MNVLALAPSTLPDATPLDFIEAAAEAEYDAVGLRMAAPYEFHRVVGNPALIRDIKRALATSGLSVLDIFTFYLQPTTDIGKFEAALETGAGFGAKYALVLGDDPEWSRLRDNFASFCGAAAGFGLATALEFAPMRPLASLPLALRLIAESGVPTAVINLDPLNLARAGGVPADLVGLDPRLFPYTQFNDGVLGPGEPDATRLGKPEMGPSIRCMPGEGSVPLYDLFDALPADIPVSVEIPLKKGLAHSSGEWAKITAASSRRFFDQYDRARSARS